jgi:predicted heme/steroid binding protein
LIDAPADGLERAQAAHDAGSMFEPDNEVAHGDGLFAGYPRVGTFIVSRTDSFNTPP